MVIELGPLCTIPVTSVTTTGAIGGVDGTCVLFVGRHEHRLRVTDALVKFSVGHGLVRGMTMLGKFPVAYSVPSSFVDPGLVEVRIGGDELDERGRARHVLLSFEGGRTRVADADAWCKDALPSHAPPKAPPPLPLPLLEDTASLDGTVLARTRGGG
jgi:hypothetical protein